MYSPNTSGGAAKFLNVKVSNDEAFFICERTIDGELVRTLETLDFTYFMDGSVKAAAATTVGGLDHLVGETVSVVADGTIVLDQRTVNSSGEITLTAAETAAYDEVEIGLNFVPTIQPMPINTSIGSGSNFMRLKRIIRINLLVYQTTGLAVDGVPIANRSFGNTTLDQAPTKFTGILEDIYPTAGWERHVIPVITCPDPTPMHIQAIEFEIESS
jgi:hypothetical protein